ncbi:hypothetical protein DM860_016396 [Cuscuta australis]|uniref:Protein kinase domain-containing protein n=1 Tax=Cuscuta australis TaxID=267555 RepID=A0A328DFT3_9ASTE|nr:hypothetical protein DM860_016396 [Cuscuta australis]
MAISTSSRSVSVVFLVLFHATTCLVVPSFGKTEAEILAAFKASLKNASALSDWDPSAGAVGPCTGGRPNWRGVMCLRGKVHGLNLNNKGLGGTIDVESLAGLPSFRVLGIMNNNFHGPMPAFKKLGSMKFLYLSRNHFSGEIPDDAFAGMQSLKKVHLANNKFSGVIPSSLAKAKRLIELMVENNKFDGEIPNFNQERLNMANFSNNNLQGEIPARFSSLKASSFSGNVGLCGKPLEPCKVDDPADSNNSRFKTIIIVGMVVLVIVAVAIAIILAMQRRKPENDEDSGGSTRAQVGTQTTADLERMERGSAGGPGKKSSPSDPQAKTGVKVSFLRDEDTGKFDLADLLKASAEVLGNGSFGSTYKAGLSSGPVVVVKRFRQMNDVVREDFVEHMRRLGKLKHKNLLPVVAFYYRKEEKLMVFDYVENGSLASHLHGKKNKSREGGLDWPTRLKIIKGVARGMLYLYNELPTMVVPNGHLKSSNVLLDAAYDPLIADYGLLPILNHDHAEEHMIAFRSPDFRQGARRLSRKTDVWALGTLILETLTGKFSTDADVVDWVKSTVPSSLDALDGDMMRGAAAKGCEGEIVKLLRIGLECCEANAEERWDMREAVERIEEVKERDNGGGGEDDFYSSYTSGGGDDIRSSRGLSDDFNQVPLNL